MTDQQIGEGISLCRVAAADPRLAEKAAAYHAKRYYAEALVDLQAARAKLQALRKQAEAQARRITETEDDVAAMTEKLRIEREYSAGLRQQARRAAEAAADTGRAQDQRAEFEAWADKRGVSLKVENGGYRFATTQLAWEAWQQARKAQEPQPAPALEWRTDPSDRFGRWEASAGPFNLMVMWHDRGTSRWTMFFTPTPGIDYLIWDLEAESADAAKVEAEARLRAFFAAGLAALSGDGTRQGEEGASDE